MLENKAATFFPVFGQKIDEDVETEMFVFREGEGRSDVDEPDEAEAGDFFRRRDRVVEDEPGDDVDEDDDDHEGEENEERVLYGRFLPDHR